MAPSLQDLRPPAAGEEQDHDDDTNTWDSTFQRELFRKSAVGSASICPHAVSVGSRVYGVSAGARKSKDDDEKWWTWQRSLAEEDVEAKLKQSADGAGANPVGLVNCISSNSDGTVIVAATDAGIVSLMRGSDGQILATRKVCSENVASIINLTWISVSVSSGSSGDKEEQNDVLLIEAPSDEKGPSSSNLILVTNIHGDRLNHHNPTVVAEAAQNMQIRPFSLDGSYKGDTGDLRAITGCMLNKTTIRLVACDCDGKFLVFDYLYNLQDKVVRFIKGDIELGGHSAAAAAAQSGTEWLIDFDVGLYTQTKDGKSFVLFTAFVKRAPPMLFWFDPSALQIACQFELPVTVVTSSSVKVIAMETVSSFAASDTLAVAVAVKSSAEGASSSGKIYVVQVLLDEILGLTVLRNPHVVFTIPMEQATISIAMASIPTAGDTGTSIAPYSFRYKLWRSGHDDCVYKEFQPDIVASTTIGKVRSLIWRGDFDPADEIVKVGVQTLVSDPHANFHPSEIALHRLQYSLAQGNPDTMEQAQHCLRRLASGAVSGSEKGMGLLLEAVDSIIQSPSNLSLENFCIGLTTVATTIQSVLRSIPADNSDKLLSKKDAIVEQMYALEFLSRAKTASPMYQLSTPFNAIQSPTHLYAVLVQERNFELAETLYRSNLKDRLTADALVLPLLKLGADVKPQAYLSLLSEVALPNLAINDDLLYRVKSWSCRMADSLDERNEEHLDLDAALILLQATDKRTRELQMKIHSSFGSFSPFAEHMEIRQFRRSPRSNSSVRPDASSSGEFNVALGSSKSKQSSIAGSIQFSKRPIPTILELGAWNGLRAGNFADVNDQGSEDCVKDKLTEAQCLREARNLGLGRDVTLLRDFEQSGGAQCIAKELVRHFSASSVTHDARLQLFNEKLTPFCERFAVCKDQAMLDCAVDLCRGKNVSARAIEESCSIVRCSSSVTVRCHVALTVLRAALLCGYTQSSLLQLSKDAIAWASCDSGLQSELEEAFRLLQIDGIVIKYCGSGARELFRVDNSRHGVRLLEFVTKHVETETVVSDALSLCDGFHHLCPHYAAQRLLEHAILHQDGSLCVSLIEKLVQKDVALSERAFVGAIAFSEEIMAECSEVIRSGCHFDRLEGYRQRARYVSSRVGSLILFAMENSLVISIDSGSKIDCYLKDTSLELLRDVFLRIERLQRDHSVYVSLADLLQMRTVIDKSSQFIEDVALCFVTNDPKLLNTKLTAAKRVCSLLTVGSKADEHDVWVAAAARIAKALVKEHQEDHVLEFLSAVGLLVDAHTGLPARTHVSVALALCAEAVSAGDGNSSQIGMQRTVKAASLMKDWSIQTSKGKLLATIVAFAGHLDVASQIFTRCDEGTGESVESLRRALQYRAWSRTLSSDSSVDGSDGGSKLAVHRPILHPSWYIGDGLLLPPDETLPRCLRFCKGLIDSGRGADDGAANLHELVGGRGAHSLALRVLCQSAAVRACSGSLRNDGALLADLQDAFDEATRALAERSLGGTGSGITSSVIDSQQALAFLLSLPVKRAFAAYKSSIPTAVKTQNFKRLYTLSNVGMLAGSGESKLGEGPIFTVGWKRQHKFFEQCQQLAAKAKWWAILKAHGVEFDSQRFQDPRAVSGSSAIDKGSTPGESKYAASLIPLMLANLSRTLSSCDVLRLTGFYAETFSLPRDLVIHRHVESLLLPGINAAGIVCSDCRFDPNRCEKTVRASLQLLHPPLKRSAVRRCLVTLDALETSGQDYERYNLVLNLYQEVLTFVVDHDLTIQPAPFEAELEVIDRRRDALAILSAFFQGDRLSHRPLFSNFFSPLPVPFNHNLSSINTHFCGILGKDSANKEDTFDPLHPLEAVLANSHDMAAVTALAPLCIPLGLPNGYIHARSLIARFRRSRANNVEYPSFENDVTPVLNRIVSASDRAVLAEWCTQQYDSNDDEKLKCLGASLQSHIQASTEIEQRRRHFPNDKTLEKQELEALESVKLITSAKAALSDALRVKTILLSSVSTKNGSVKQISEHLVSELDRQLQDTPNMSPEALIDFLYTTGSLLAAQTSLDNNASFSVSHFRQFCSIVHSACRSVAEQHSHIDPCQRARRFAQRWLFYGDETGITSITTDDTALEPVATSGLDDIEEEDTMDFVMDLSVIQTVEDDWSNTAVNKLDSPKERRMISAEETSALQRSSSRELSDAASQRAALRIAFVMAFSGSSSTAISDEAIAKENSDANRPRSDTMNRFGFKAQLLTKRDTLQDNKVFDLSQELLGIVFARSGASTHLISRWHSFDSDTSIPTSRKDALKTITFAMRHRALRAASILCPQEALEDVIRNEGYLRSSNNLEQCTLHQCSFGAFLAKEIEEMGLPLPHSDLVQLSSMNFLSYARTLWPHHRDDDVLHNSKGRLLLLLVEMSLQSEDTGVAFVKSLLGEMVNLNLPRTLLMSLEHIAEFQERVVQPHSVSGELVTKALPAVAIAILSEACRLLTDPAATVDQSASLQTIETFERLFKIAAAVLDSESMSTQFCSFADVLTASCKIKKSSFAEKLLSITTEARDRAERTIHGIKVRVDSEHLSLTSTRSTGDDTTP